MRIYGSLLGVSALRLEEMIRRAERAGIDGFHLDISDGCFAPSLSFGPWMATDVASVTKRPVQAHLMVVKPRRYFGQLAGVETIYFHVEASDDPEGDIRAVKSMGAMAGVALLPETVIERLKGIIRLIDSVLLLTVRPGYSGQAMLEGSGERIREALKLREEHGFSLVVDGGVEPSRAGILRGVDAVVSGSYVFGGYEPERRIAELKGALGD